MKLHVAQAIAEKLVKRIIPQGGGYVGGSVRRGKPEPRDIELILPWGDGRCDPIYQAVIQLAGDPDAELFGDHVDRVFRAVSGLKPGFRYCQIEGIPSDAWDAVEPGLAAFKVDLFRYDAGPTGNLGWIQLMRTGPGDFGRDCLAHFKKHGGGGSQDGYLVSGGGRVIATPIEITAFKAMHIAWLEPHQRTSDAIRFQDKWHEPLTAEDIPF